MAVYPTAKPTVVPAAAPETAAPSVVVQTDRKLEFMKEPEPVEPARLTKISARLAAEHSAGADALANYS